MVAHAGYLRQFWDVPAQTVTGLVRALREAGEAAAALGAEAGVACVQERLDELRQSEEWAASVSEPDWVLLRFVTRVVLAPRSMQREHLQPLRAAGFVDPDIHDVVQVICCFSYMNRLSDALGVATEREEEARELLGEAALQDHQRWAARAGIEDASGEVDPA